MSMTKSLRFIAILEASKGVFVLLAGFGLLGLIHHDAQHVGEELVRHFHLNPASRFPRIFIEAVTKASDTTLWLLACAAFSYAVLRLFEAWGLWRQRRWAEWLAAISGAIYIPIEIYELSRSVSWATVSLLVVNTANVVYFTHALRTHNNSRNA